MKTVICDSLHCIVLRVRLVEEMPLSANRCAPSIISAVRMPYSLSARGNISRTERVQLDSTSATIACACRHSSAVFRTPSVAWREML